MKSMSYEINHRKENVIYALRLHCNLAERENNSKKCLFQADAAMKNKNSILFLYRISQRQEFIPDIGNEFQIVGWYLMDNKETLFWFVEWKWRNA